MRLRRSAFTLVELLVVIAIIGVLVALLLPAVQAARESSRRMSCQNNLKQMGLGFHNFESARGGLPPRRYSSNTDGHGYVGWGAIILPYMEQAPLWDKYDLRYDYYDPVNAPVTNIVLPFYKCPTTPHTGTKMTSGGKATAGSQNADKTTNFFVSTYMDYMVPNGLTVPTNGWGAEFSYNGAASNFVNALWDSSPSFTPYTPTWTPRRMSEIKDGTSNTLLVNEMAGWPMIFKGGVRQPGLQSQTQNRGHWAGWQSFVYATYSPDGLTAGSSTSGDTTPCAVNCANQNQIYGFHPAGANVLYCDGSVRFAAANMKALLFAQICVIDDGMTLAE
ncbi:DUF1559 domain-containing protein [Anatilimnocola sp. NA78]|uniref:DUF1559 family PulG-like putative transporter n=1 Tax=Anatilimnocola sp. NA78 TaxID=3415683 RepID=UPI003CE45867